MGKHVTIPLVVREYVRVFFYPLIENVDEQFRDCTEYDEFHVQFLSYRDVILKG